MKATIIILALIVSIMLGGMGAMVATIINYHLIAGYIYFAKKMLKECN